MAAVSNKITRFINDQSNVRLKVRLKDVFDIPFFPKDDGLRQAIGQVILDMIKGHAEGSDFFSGSTKKGYSEEYAESESGIVYGKKKGDKVNLRASGDMLESMVLNLDDDNSIVIEFSDSTESEKAHGHINGSDVLPRRDFFGLSTSDIRELRGQFESRVIDAAALEMAGEVIQQGDQTDLDFITRLLSGES